MQISEIKTALEYVLQDISDVSDAVFLSWCNDLNNLLYRESYVSDSERFITSTDISVNSSTDTYALPVNFLTIQPYGCGLYYVDDEGKVTSTVRPRTSIGSRAPGYYIKGTNIVFTPEPTVNETWRLFYIPTVSKFTAVTEYWTNDKLLTGTPIVPDSYQEMIVNGILKYYYQWDNDMQNEVAADARFMRSLGEYLKTVRKEPLAFALNETSIIY